MSILLKTVLLLQLLLLLQPGNLSAQNSAPDWTKGAIWYEIFVERFKNLNPGNDPVKSRTVGEEINDWQVHPWASDWYKLQVWEKPRKDDFYDLIEDRRYGGDLLGVIERLTYLQALGVDVIDLSPVFESPTADKYGAASYHHVDNNFGYNREEDLDKVAEESDKEDPEEWVWTTADRALADLIYQAHQSEIKVVIQAVFNYCHRDFWAFKDLEEKQQKSEYKDWFVVYHWDDPATPDTVEFDYQTWKGDDDLPVFRQDEAGLVDPVKKYIFNITRRWMTLKTEDKESAGLDGWHIKHAYDVPGQFWQEWTDLVYELNPEAVTVADSYSTADSLSAFTTEVSVPFMLLVRDFMSKNESGLSVSSFDRELQQLRKSVGDMPRAAVLNSINGFDTHRFASLLKNPTTRTNGHTNDVDSLEWDPRPPNDAEQKQRRLAVMFQMLYTGSPLIFYGDESGMWGGRPDHLKPMLWGGLFYEDEDYSPVYPQIEGRHRVGFDRDLFRFYRDLSKIRHEYEAIRTGDFETRITDDERGIYGFARVGPEEEVIIILNTGAERQTVEVPFDFKSGTKIKDILADEEYKVKNRKIKIEVATKSGVILVKG